jgi:uncharacterized protein (DUF4415 family)
MTAKKKAAMADSENPELTREEITRAIPSDQFFTASELAALTARYPGQRGPQKSPTKERVTLRIDRATLAAFRSSGPGWQKRIDEILRSAATNSVDRKKAAG